MGRTLPYLVALAHREFAYDSRAHVLSAAPNVASADARHRRPQLSQEELGRRRTPALVRGKSQAHWSRRDRRRGCQSRDFGRRLENVHVCPYSIGTYVSPTIIDRGAHRRLSATVTRTCIHCLSHRARRILALREAEHPSLPADDSVYLAAKYPRRSTADRGADEFSGQRKLCSSRDSTSIPVGFHHCHG